MTKTAWHASQAAWHNRRWRGPGKVIGKLVWHESQARWHSRRLGQVMRWKD